MQDFDLTLPTRIHFGRRAHLRLIDECSQYGRNVLLLYGGESVKRFGIYEKIVEPLKRAHYHIIEMGGVKSNAKVDFARSAIRRAREERVDQIVSVGGGSVNDTAKAVAIGTPYDGDIWDFFEGRVQVEESLPVGVVPTIAGSGTETSSASVLTNTDTGVRTFAASDVMRPAFALLNPEFTFSVPPHKTAAGAVDMLGNLMARYFGPPPDTVVTDRMCEAAISTVVKCTPLAIKEPFDYDARAELLWTSALAHSGLFGAGRTEDWGVRDIEDQITIAYDTPYCTQLGPLLLAWMRVAYLQQPVRFDALGQRLFPGYSDQHSMPKSRCVLADRFEDFFRAIGVATRLGELGLGTKEKESLIRKCSQDGIRSGLIDLNSATIRLIIEAAL